MSKYDYIIVGGGSAGAVIASRLSEDESSEVLLVEAGKDWRAAEAPPEIRSPNFFFVLTELDEEFVWPDLTARLNETRKPEPYVVGKGLGGGSTVNGQFYVRPPLSDFDRWEMLGAEGWSGDDVLQYFIKAESDLEFGSRSYHGDTGPIPVWRRDGDDWASIDKALYEAARDLGHPEARDRDFNSPENEGLSRIPFNIEDGERVSTNDGYLEPARARDNLTIRGGTLVDTVLLDGHEAIGVEAVTAAGWRDVFLGDNIVLCAGAIQTPGILMRSGIGPAAQLHEIGVTVKIDHPGMGRLIDHPLLVVTYALKEEYRAAPPAPNDFFSSLMLVWSSETPYGRDLDMQVLPSNFIGTTAEALKVGGLTLALMDVYSHGQLRITSADPTDAPDIFVNMLGDRRDLVRVREGLRHVFELSQHEAIDNCICGEAKLAPLGGEGKAISAFDGDDQALEAAILEQCAQYFHPVGTCRMGDPNDETAVVDPNCRVIGAEDLYVADASIMPDIVRANTNATCIMIGEYVAEKFRTQQSNVSLPFAGDRY